MGIALATAAADAGGRNDDWAGVTVHGIAVVLDGQAQDGPIGCVHGTRWFVHQLGTRLLALAGEPSTGPGEASSTSAEAAPGDASSGGFRRPLRDALADAIDAVRRLHGTACDLADPGGPAAAVAILRVLASGAVEHLVLGDAVVLIDDGGGTPAVYTGAADGQRPAGGSDGHRLARHDLAAAAEAIIGTTDGLLGAALLSGGGAALATRYGAMTFRELLDVAVAHGPGDVIAATREIERTDGERRVWPRSRTHDDATIVVYQK